MPPPRRQTYAERAAAIALVNTLDNADCRRLQHDLHMSTVSGARLIGATLAPRSIGAALVRQYEPKIQLAASPTRRQ